VQVAVVVSSGHDEQLRRSTVLRSPRRCYAAAAAMCSESSLAHVQNLVQLGPDRQPPALADTPPIGDLVNLRTLTLGEQFSDSALPDALFKLTRLNVLDVAYNSAGGRVDRVAPPDANWRRCTSTRIASRRCPTCSTICLTSSVFSVRQEPPLRAAADAGAACTPTRNVNLEDNQLEPTLASLCFLGFSAVREYLLQPDEAKSASAAVVALELRDRVSAASSSDAELGRGAFGMWCIERRCSPSRRAAATHRSRSTPAPVAEPIVVAVKVLSLRVDQIATEAGRRRFVDDFRRELAMLAKTAQSWSFPASVRRHFVGFYGACTQDPFCLVTEYCERGSLYDMLARYGRRLHSSVRYHVAIEVAEGLHNLHSHTPDAILHHDVKTSNILITQDFAIKLADFGLARVQASTRLAARLAADGNVLSSDDDEDDNDESESEDDRTDSFVGSGGLSTQEKLADPLREALFQSSTGSAFNESASGYDDDGDVYDGKLGESAELDGYDSVSSYYARTGSGGGTCFFVPYAAPEILRGGRYDIAAETFSFGMVLWCLAAGGEPFSGRSLTAIRQAKLSGKPLPSTDRSVDTVFSNLVTRCTAAAREARPSFPSIIAELREARDRLDLRSVVLPDE
jgi:serine/threonine protein kinase